MAGGRHERRDADADHVDAADDRRVPDDPDAAAPDGSTELPDDVDPSQPRTNPYYGVHDDEPESQ